MKMPGQDRTGSGKLIGGSQKQLLTDFPSSYAHMQHTHKQAPTLTHTHTHRDTHTHLLQKYACISCRTYLQFC